MAKAKLNVKGVKVSIDTFHEEDYISLTDIARQSESQNAHTIIQSWMKNRNTLDFLAIWEELNNPDFKPSHLTRFKEKYLQNRYVPTPKRWIEEVGAKGMVSKAGRYGGTFAHQDIAIHFCSWLSPGFQLYLIKEFRRLKEAESQQQNLKWHVRKITDNIENVRNLLDTIPGQDPIRNRIKGKE